MSQSPIPERYHVEQHLTGSGFARTAQWAVLDERNRVVAYHPTAELALADARELSVAAVGERRS